MIVVHFSHGENRVEVPWRVKLVMYVVGAGGGRFTPPHFITQCACGPRTTKVSTRPTAPPAGEMMQSSSPSHGICGSDPCACIIPAALGVVGLFSPSARL